MWSESAFFVNWLHQHRDASILPSQVETTEFILDRLEVGDLVSVLFNSERLAPRALTVLKARYEDERHALEEMNRGER